MIGPFGNGLSKNVCWVIKIERFIKRQYRIAT
jgi:hypothetical protein